MEETYMKEGNSIEMENRLKGVNLQAIAAAFQAQIQDTIPPYLL